MKLIIDIPEDVYKNIKEYYKKSDVVETIYSYIYHGIPLDKIKAEIEQAKYWEYGQLVGTPNYLADGLETALKIIDKHIGDTE